MEFLAGLYTLLLVTICLLLAVVLWKLNKPRNGGDYEELKRWMQQQLDAQAKDFAARQAEWQSRITPPSAASVRRCRPQCRA